MSIKKRDNLKKPIPFFNVTGYRPFTSYWWEAVWTWLTGFYYSFELKKAYWGWPGWALDIYDIWHRARYGWAPGDVGELDAYLNDVLAGSLFYMAEHTIGVPANLVNDDNENNVDVAAEKWTEMLKGWAKAFSENPQDVAIFDRPDYVKQKAEEERRREAIHKALKEIEPLWEALWD